MPDRRSKGTVFVALLRGINLGRARQVAMADLKAIVESLGFRNVQTLLRSGNVVFTVPGGAGAADPEAVAARLVAALESGLAMRIGVVLRTAEELATVVAANPIPEAAGEGSLLHVMFLGAPLAAKERVALETESFDPDVVRALEREVWVWYRHGMSGSTTAARLDRIVRTLATDRNWNTVQRLLALAQGGPAS